MRNPLTNCLLAIILLLLFVGFLPAVAVADVDFRDGLVPENCQAGAPCTICDVYDLAKNILDFLLIAIAIPLAAAVFLWGGIRMITAQGSPEKISEAKKILYHTVIGLGLAFFGWVIIQGIVSTVVVQISVGDTPTPIEWFSKPSFCEKGGGALPEAPIPEPTTFPPLPEVGTDAHTRLVLETSGIDTNAECPTTCLDRMRQTTFDGALRLKQNCGGCTLVITGANEAGHAGGTAPGTHGGGDKLDFRFNPQLDSYVQGLPSCGASCYRGPQGERFIKETTPPPSANPARWAPHWDVCFADCRS